MSIRLIASDLDGTLLTDCKELSPKTREVLDLAVQHGIYIVPATGRSFYSIPEMIRNYPGVEYVITANGGAVYSVREGKRVYQCLLEKESVEAAIAVRKRENMVLEVVIDGVPYAEELDSISFVCRYEDKERLYTSLDKEIPNIYVTSSVPNLMEVGHIDAGKGKTLLWLLKKLEISTEEAMAFGDADNDISMLTSVKYGMAMGNGTENCRKAAPYVTDTNEKDGVAKGILRFLSEVE